MGMPKRVCHSHDVAVNWPSHVKTRDGEEGEVMCRSFGCRDP